MVPLDCQYDICRFLSVPETLEGPRLVSKSLHRASLWRTGGVQPWLLYRVRRFIRRWRRGGQERRRAASWQRRIYHPDDRMIL